jgi:hypothetical protein
MDTRTISLGVTEWETLDIVLLNAKSQLLAMSNLAHATDIEQMVAKLSARIIGDVIDQLNGQAT